MDPHNPASPPLAPHSEAILQELAWLRRVASALLGRGEDAEDLAQEVLLEALRQGERTQTLEKPRLRSWLRTVAQRKAWRSRTRTNARRDSEARRAADDATQEPAADETLERLELHRELIREIEQLASDDRELISQRYLQGLTPKAIATHIGVSPAIVRKRLARALERLRARLHSSPRGGSWMDALAFLACEVPGPVPPLVSASTGALATLPWIVMKLSLLAGALGLSLTALWFVRSQDQVALVPGTTSASAGEHALEDSAKNAQAEETLAALGPSRVSGRELPIPSPFAPSEVLSIRAVLAGGDPASGALGAFVSANGETTAFTFDQDGLALIPLEFEGHAFAAAPGLRTARLALAEGGPTADLVLRKAQALEGTITVDGQPPNEALQLSEFLSNRAVGLEADQAAARNIMEEAGLVPERVWVTVNEAGAFHLDLTWVLESAETPELEFLCPPAFLVTTVNGVPVTTDRSRFSLAPGTGTFHVDLERLPAVRGRLIWSDSRKPIPGGIVHQRLDAEGKAMDGIPYLKLDEMGGFVVPAVGIPRNGATQAGPPATTLVLHVQHPPAAAGTQFRFPLAGLDLPADLGDLEVERALPLPVLVRGQRADGSVVPVQAGLTSPDTSASTGADGRGTIPCRPGEAIEILAAGWHYRQVFVPQGLFTPESPLELLLEPAPRLTLVGCEKLRANSPTRAPAVRITFDWTPFQTAELDEDNLGVPYGNRLHNALGKAVGSGTGVASWSHVTPGAPGYVEYRLPAGDVLEIPGLMDARPFSVQVVDTLGQLLMSEEVTLSASRTIDLTQAASATASVQCQIQWADQTPVDSGKIRLSGNAGRAVGQSFEKGTFQLGSLAPGKLDLEVSASGSQVTEVVVELQPGEETRTTIYLQRQP